MKNQNLIDKVNSFSPENKLEIMAPKRTAMKLAYYTIEAIPRNNDMIYHVTANKPIEDTVFMRIPYRIVVAIHNKFPDTYYTNIIPVRKLNSVAIEIFGIVNHPLRNSICSDIFKALCKEFSAFDDPKVMTKIKDLK